MPPGRLGAGLPTVPHAFGGVARLFAGATVLCWTLAACSSAVDAVAPGDAGSALCTAASRAWPATVGRQKARAVSSRSPAVRAWGDPAIIARCGVVSPGPTTDECLSVDDIDWVAHQLSDGVRFTTYGRSPAIEVLVPRAYETPGGLLPAFTAAARAIPQGPHRCT